MKQYLTKVKEAIEFFDKIAFTKVPQEENAQALAKPSITRMA